MRASKVAWVVGIVALAVLLFCLLRWEYMWEGEFLGKWASVVTMASLVVAPVAYFMKKRWEARDESSRASKNLYIELDDASDGLNEKKYAADFKKVNLPDGRGAYFMNIMFNHDFYDSLVSSGKINFLPPSMQQSVQDVFHKIKDHNSFIRKIREIEDNSIAGEDVSMKKMRYYELLAKTEEELLGDINTVKEKLRKEFKIG